MATEPSQLAARGHTPIAATAMPAWVYRNATMTRLEIERLLKPSWQIACHVNSIPRPGDYVTFELGPESLLVLRDRDGAVRAFHNVCRHRGARLLDGVGRCPGAITCPYHGWTYRLDGSIQGVAQRDTFGELDREALGLRPVVTETLLGFVFVNLGEAPEPLLPTFAPLMAELAPYRIEQMVPLGPITTEEWAADWKLVIDNYLESYHVPIGHPGLARMFTPDYEDQRGGGAIARGTSWVRTQPSARWSERQYQSMMGRSSPHLPETYRRCWRFYSVLPNLGLDLYPEQMDFFQVLPNGPGRALIRSGLFGLPDASREVRVARALTDRINRGVNAEDRWLCERVQRGLASSSYQPGPLSSIEGWMVEFHQRLRTRIPESRLPQPPAVFAGDQPR